MSAQIAFTLPDQKKKTLLQKQLIADGLTVKSFFNFCVNGYLEKKIRIGVLSSSDQDAYENLSANEASNLSSMKNLSTLMNHI